MIVGNMIGFSNLGTTAIMVGANRASASNGGAVALGSDYAVGGDHGLQATTDGSPFGSAYIECLGFASTEQLQGSVYLDIATGYISAAFNVPTLPASDLTILYIVDTTGARKCEVRLSSTGTLKFRDKDGNALAETAFQVTADTPFRVVVKAPNGTSAEGEMRVYSSLTTDTAAETETATGNFLATNTGGAFAGILLHSAAIEVHVGHVVVADDWVPAGTFVTLVPKADGTDTGFTAGVGDGDYRDLDELPPDGDTTYLFSGSGLAETPLLQSCEDAGIAAGSTVHALKPMIWLKRNSGTSSQGLRVRVGSSVVDTGTGISGAFDYVMLGRCLSVNPDTTDPWASDDSIEVGQVQLSGTGAFRLSWAGAEAFVTEAGDDPSKVPVILHHLRLQGIA